MNQLSEQWTPVQIENGILKYNYKKIEYYKNGWVRTEQTSNQTVELYNKPTSNITTTYTYYPDGNIKAITYSDGRKTEYQYDADGCITEEKQYKDATNYNLTTYTNNYLGKPETKKITVPRGELYPYETTDTTPTYFG